jgi:hypothetical protein
MPNAEVQLDIGLDHIRIERGHDDVGRKSGAGEALVDMAPAGEAHMKGDDRPFGDRLQRQGMNLSQRVAFGNDQPVMPGIVG